MSLKKIDIPDEISRVEFNSYEINWYEWQELVNQIGKHNKMLDDAVEVTSANNFNWISKKLINIKYKALLINIETIKKESCADVLRDIIKDNEHEYKEHTTIDLLQRAKAALEREGE